MTSSPASPSPAPPRWPILALAALSIAAIVAWLWNARPAARSPATTVADRPGDRGRAEALAVAREAVEGAAARRPAEGGAGTPARDATPDSEALRGVVYDIDGAPRAGAVVRAVIVTGDSYRLLERGALAAPRELASCTTGDDGAFRFEPPPGRAVRLEVTAAGRAVEHVTDCYAGQRVDVHLHAGATLRGRVVRALDEAPIEGVVLRGVRRAAGERGNAVALFEVLTDAGGRYAANALSPGSVEVAVRPPAGAAPRARELELVDAAETVLDVRIDAGSVVRGHVIADDTGVPIAGARVGAGWRLDGAVRTARDGSFTIDDFPDGHLDLSAHADGFALATLRVRRTGGAEIVAAVEFRLVRGRAARGRIADQDGAPIGGCYVAAVAYEHVDGGAARIDWRVATSSADGNFLIDGLRRDVAHALFVQNEGHGSAVWDFPPNEATVEVVELGELRLLPGSRVHGRVVDESGAGIARLGVELAGCNADRLRFGGPASPGYRPIDGYVAERSAVTDDAGRCSFTDLAPGRYTLRAHLPGAHHQLATREIVVAWPGEVVDAGDLLLRRGYEIRGRVEVDDSGPLPKVYVSVDPTDGAQTAADVEVGNDGTFSAVGLGAGLYSLTAYPYASEDDKRTGRSFASLVVRDVAAGGAEVVIRLVRQR